MFHLTNALRDYAWGSPTAIPGLLGTPETGGPQAELWIGAHPAASSHVTEHAAPLDRVLAERPELLGDAARARHGDALPYLMKVLAAAQPLSLQVHPNLDQARAGFAAEEASGKPLDDPTRNYKDANHKPEIILALTDFVALCGFRRPAEALADLQTLADRSARGGVGGRLAAALSLPDESDALRAAFALLLSGDADLPTLVAQVAAGASEHPRLPAARTVRFVAQHYATDPGVVATLLLNRVELTPGQALYLDAGHLHAYLEGLGIESMATSDNVVRGGLTGKHVDVAELARLVRFRSMEPTLVEPVVTDLGGAALASYWPPVAEFAVHHLAVTSECPVALPDLDSPVVLLVTAGELLVGASGEPAAQGETLFFAAGEPIAVASREGAEAYLTSTGRPPGGA